MKSSSDLVLKNRIRCTPLINSLFNSKSSSLPPNFYFCFFYSLDTFIIICLMIHADEWHIIIIIIRIKLHVVIELFCSRFSYFLDVSQILWHSRHFECIMAMLRLNKIILLRSSSHQIRFLCHFRLK